MWGAYHALLFLPLILTGKNRKYTNQIAEGRYLPTFKEAGQMLLTFILAVFGWIVFRSESIGQAWEVILGIMNSSLFTAPMVVVGLKKIVFVIGVLLLVEWLNRSKEHGLAIGNLPLWLRIASCYVLVLVILELGGNSQSFIYFQF